MKEISVAILGAGGMGHKHATILSAFDGVSVSAVCDTNAEQANKLAGKLDSAPAVFSDFQTMYDKAKPDVVFVCLPPFAHSTEVTAAASRGIHVFIEKPIALTSAHALAMAEAVESAGVISQVGYMLRYAPAITKVRALIADGSAGKPTLYRGLYSCNSLHADWWRERSLSGGQLFEQAIHVYDLSLAFLGAPTSVAARMANLAHTAVERYTSEDTSASVIQFESGAIATIAATNCGIPRKWHHEFTLVCEKLVATVTGGTQLEITYTDGEKPRTETETLSADPYVAEDEAFIAAIRGGGKTDCPLRTGYAGVRLVEAANESSAGGKFIAL